MLTLPSLGERCNSIIPRSVHVIIVTVFPSFPRTHAGCKGDTQQGLPENTESGGETGPAHSQQQED